MEKLITEYDKLCRNTFDSMTQTQLNKYAENSKFTVNLRESISNSGLNKTILKHITPYFYIAKQTEL